MGTEVNILLANMQNTRMK